MFNDKMLLPPALDEGTEGCVDLEGGWLVMTPSSLECDDIVGKSVADGLMGGSMDKLGGTVVGEPIGGSMDKFCDSVAEELVGNGKMEKNGGSVADELVGKIFKNCVSAADELVGKIFENGESVADELDDGDRRSDKIWPKSGGSALVDGRASLF
jgi:hypothetical protein